MPFTFFAHQVPVLPLKERAPDRWDGLGLVIGSIIPDLWYVSHGWLYGPFGWPLWVDGHRLDLVLQNCVIPGVILTVLLRRWAMPVVPAVLPKGGFLRLRDYRLLALSRHRWWVTAYSVLVGAMTHIFVDGFTHVDGWAVEGLTFLREPVPIYRALQYGGHVFGSLLACWMLLRISRRKLQWAWHGYAGRRPADPVVADPGRTVIWSALGLGTVAALAYATVRLVEGDGPVAALMAFVWVGLATLLVAGLVGRRYVTPLPEVPPLPTSVDPLLE